MFGKILRFILIINISFAFAQGAGNAISDRSWVLIPTSYLSNVQSDFSVEAWISPSATDLLVDGASAIVSNKYHHSENFDGGFALVIDKQRLRFTIRDRYGVEYNLDAVAGEIVANKWQHVAAAFKYDNDSGNRFMYLWINGVLVNSRQVTTQERLNEGSKTHIGNSTIVEGQIFNGKIDEVRIWNLALDSDNVRANMCRRLVSFSANLLAYWRLDETSGTIITDAASTNDGTLYKNDLVSADGRVTSGAPIGDVSTYDYSSPSVVMLSHTDGDNIVANSFTGSPDGVQLYRIDEAPNVTTPPGNISQLFTSRYWGVFVVGGSSPTYSFIYNYSGNPDIGIWENYLDLASRASNGVTSWTELNADLNTSVNTLTITGQTGTEYIIGKEDAPTPVELMLFTAQKVNKEIVLKWETATEVNNYGFEIHRCMMESIDGNSENKFEAIGFIAGAGNCNSPQNYTFIDSEDLTGQIKYRLKQIDIDGNYKYSKTIQIDLDKGNEILQKFELMQNFPNPFNPTTEIKFQLAERGEISLVVYDILGNEAAVLIDGMREAGSHSIIFNAEHLSSGVYFYKLQTEKFHSIKKLVLLK